MDGYTLIWSKNGVNTNGEDTTARIYTDVDSEYYVESVVDGNFDTAYAFTLEEAKDMARSLFR